MRSSLGTFGSLFLALLASGPAAAQTPPAAGSPPSASGVPAAPGPSPATSATDSPPAVVVDDPMLAPMPPPEHVITTWEDAARMLRSRSTDLRRAHDDILRAEADSRTALGAVLPTLSASGTASHTILPTQSGGSVIDTGTAAGAQVVPSAGGGRNSLTGSLRLSVPLVDFKGWHNHGTAKVGEEAARLDYENLERTTAAGLASAIAVNVTAERVSEIGRLGLRNALERLALAEAKERTGTGTGLDIVRARQDVAQARSSLVTSDEALRKSRDALGLAVGLTEPVGVTPSTDLAAIRTGVLKACRQLPELEARADLRSAEKDIEVGRPRPRRVGNGILSNHTAG